MKAKIFLASFAILLIVFAYQCKKVIIVVPDELVGIWKTTEPKYRGSFFELTNERIIIGTIQGQVDSNMIKKIEKEEIPSEKRILYSIFYSDPQGLESKFFIYYYPSNHEIRFKNQQQFAWRKSPKR